MKLATFQAVSVSSAGCVRAGTLCVQSSSFVKWSGNIAFSFLLNQLNNSIICTKSIEFSAMLMTVKHFAFQLKTSCKLLLKLMQFHKESF